MLERFAEIYFMFPASALYSVNAAENVCHLIFYDWLKMMENAKNPCFTVLQVDSGVICEPSAKSNSTFTSISNEHPNLKVRVHWLQICEKTIRGSVARKFLVPGQRNIRFRLQSADALEPVYT